MAPVDRKYICSTNGSSSNSTGVHSRLENEEFNALLYIVVTLLFYSLGIIIGIITYLKRERREMAEDKEFEDFLTWQIDPFTTIKAQRVQQVAAKLREIEKIQKQRELEQFRQELELGAGDPAKMKMASEKKSHHALRMPRFSWSKASWRRRDDSSCSRDSKTSSEEHCTVPLDHAVAGCTDIACHVVHSQHLSAPKHEHKLSTKRNTNLLQSTKVMNRQFRLQSSNDESVTVPLQHGPYAESSLTKTTEIEQE